MINIHNFTEASAQMHLSNITITLCRWEIYLLADWNPPPLAVSGTLAFFFTYRHICICFCKLWTEYGKKKIENVPWKKNHINRKVKTTFFKGTEILGSNDNDNNNNVGVKTEWFPRGIFPKGTLRVWLEA